MRSLVLWITLITVAAGAARATEMVEVPNPPPYLPPREPTRLERKIETAKLLRFGGFVLLGAGTALSAAGVVVGLTNPCTHDCFLLQFVEPEQRATFGALVATGAVFAAAGLPLTFAADSYLRKLRKAELTLHASGSGVSLSGRF